MQPAMVSVVDTHVRYGNRQALLELWSFRSNFKRKCETLAAGYDPSMVLGQLEDEMAIIEAGIAKLFTAAVA